MLAQSLPQKQHQEIQNAGEAGQGFPESVHPAPELRCAEFRLYQFLCGVGARRRIGRRIVELSMLFT